MSVTKRELNPRTGRKTFLFCPDCKRSAPIGDGWSRERRGGRIEIGCPNCETVLVSQPYSEHRSPSLSV